MLISSSSLPIYWAIGTTYPDKLELHFNYLNWLEFNDFVTDLFKLLKVLVELLLAGDDSSPVMYK